LAIVGTPKTVDRYQFQRENNPAVQHVTATTPFQSAQAPKSVSPVANCHYETNGLVRLFDFWCDIEFPMVTPNAITVASRMVIAAPMPNRSVACCTASSAMFVVEHVHCLHPTIYERAAGHDCTTAAYPTQPPLAFQS
jgi:hypothetical protein